MKPIQLMAIGLMGGLLGSLVPMPTATAETTRTSDRDWMVERLKRACDEINQICVNRCQEQIKLPPARKSCYKSCNIAYARCLREAERD